MISPSPIQSCGGEFCARPVAVPASAMASIHDLVRDLVSDDEVMLGLNRGLHVVANHAGQAIARHHQPCIGIGERHLLIRRSLDGGF
jgi:hypothetical protein